MLRNQVFASSQQQISISEIGKSILDDDKLNLREAIDALVNEDMFRKTPPFTYATDRVIATRFAECRAARGISAAIVATARFADLAKSGDTQARETLLETAISAIGSIDQTPGSAASRRQLLDDLKQQMSAAADDTLWTMRLMADAERIYNERSFNAILDKYARNPLPHSPGYDEPSIN